jgi:hypothetical protein
VPSRAVSVVPRTEPIELDAAGLDRVDLLFERRVDGSRSGAEDADVAEHTGLLFVAASV